jgi:hypothetical protein
VAEDGLRYDRFLIEQVVEPVAAIGLDALRNR